MGLNYNVALFGDSVNASENQTESARILEIKIQRFSPIFLNVMTIPVKLID